MHFLALAQILLLVLPVTVSAHFGFIEDHRAKTYTIDNGASLVIGVSTISGDIVSFRYHDNEYNGYDGKNSHVESGLGPSDVRIEQITLDVPVIKISVTHGTLRHYIVVRYKRDHVYVFTDKADNDFRVQRYIVRFKGGIFPASSNDTDWLPGDCQTIEAQDICQTPDGRTFSKHYSGIQYGRVIDHEFVGRSNGQLGMYLIRSNHEKASGGPFFRSLVRRGSPQNEDLYDIYYYNMGSTDPERFGLQGPSTLVFTDGQPPEPRFMPSRVDYGWFDGLGIDNWVPASKRGRISGTGLTNTKPDFEYVIGLSNRDAQYWSRVSEYGEWAIDRVLPGTYTLTVYKGELDVHAHEVAIDAGDDVVSPDIACDNDPADVPAVWRIGDWDGVPRTFRNFESTPFPLTYMHPSDSRLAPWSTGPFTVGESVWADFPSYMWQDVNNGQVVQFRLSPDDLARDELTVRIGVTQAYAGGRPRISVNDQFQSPIPPPTNQAKTRSLTVGTYRGNNVMLTYQVPRSAWINDLNALQTMTIEIVTGSKGSGFLSGGCSIDAVDLIYD